MHIFSNFIENYYNFIVLLGILIGIIECFWGYKLFKFTLAIAGFITGLIAGTKLGYLYTSRSFISLLFGFMGGVIGALISLVLYYLGVFFVGSLVGYLAGIIIMGTHFFIFSQIILIIFSIVGGILALLFQKFMIIFATSFGGAWSIVNGFAYIMYPMKREFLTNYIILTIWIVLGISGFIIQYKIFTNSEAEISKD